MALYGDDPKKKNLQGVKTNANNPTKKAFNNELAKVRSLAVKKTVKPIVKNLVRDGEYKPSGPVSKKEADISPLLKKSVLKYPR
jgi:hypothetical protein